MSSLKISIRRIRFTLAGVVCAASSLFSVIAEDEGPSQLLFFNNGDSLSGRLAALDPAGSCDWGRDDLDAPASFKSDAIRSIRFLSRPENSKEDEASADVPTWKVYLDNDDEIEGADPTLADGVFSIDSYAFGRIEIPWSRVRHILPVYRRQPPLVDGFHELDGWKNDIVDVAGRAGGQWTYKNDAVYAFAAASLAKRIDLPEVGSIKMDLAWRGTLSIAIGLYTDSLEAINLLNKETEPPFKSFYSLAIFNQGAVLRSIDQHSPIQNLGQVFIPTLNQKDHATFEILVNKEEGAVRLVIDGKAVHTWIDGAGFSGEGSGMRIVHQGHGSVRLSGFEVRRWNGNLEEQAASPQALPVLDHVWPLEGASVSGEILGVSNRELRLIDKEGNEQRFAVDKIRRVVTKRPEGVLVKPTFDHKAVLSFANDDRLTVDLRSMSADSVNVTFLGKGPYAASIDELKSVRFP
jgi:hypothetical protein